MLLNRRERTQNWTPKEKSALFSLIKSHVHVIENKKIDMATSAMKCRAWQQIHCAFRSRFSTDRDVTRIKEQWRRMKAQARMEINAYSEKVRTLGLEAAVKSPMSGLSIEVWRLMESMRSNDAEVVRHSDDSNEDNENQTSRVAIYAMLDELMSPPALETSAAPGHREIKIEADSDAEDENSRSELSSQKSSDDFSLPKRHKIAVDSETADVVEQKSPCLDREISTPHVDNAAEGNATPSVSTSWNGPAATSNREEVLQKAMWIFKSSQREHEIKLQMLHVELERAQLQKQTAINELKTSEIKKQMIETQAVSYYSQIRMAGERGSGAGKGGGTGGTIRDAGGSFGKMEAAHEDQYFYNLQKDQLQKMRESLHDEISFHEEQIKRHQEAINRHKKRITDMEQKE